MSPHHRERPKPAAPRVSASFPFSPLSTNDSGWWARIRISNPDPQPSRKREAEVLATLVLEKARRALTAAAGAPKSTDAAQQAPGPVAKSIQAVPGSVAGAATVRAPGPDPEPPDPEPPDPEPPDPEPPDPDPDRSGTSPDNSALRHNQTASGNAASGFGTVGKKIEKWWPARDGPHPPISDSASGLADFIAYRFYVPLTSSGKGARWATFFFAAFSLATIAAGLGSAALATFADAGSTDSGARKLTTVAIVVAGLGVLVGIFTALNQIFRPSQRSIAHHQLRHALLREGWDYVAGRGKYDETPAVALDAFYDTVRRLHQRVDIFYETPAGPGQ